MKSLIIVGCLFALYLPLQTLAESRTWNGSVDKLWSNADNWSPAGIPQEGDDVIIPKSTSVIIYEDMPNLNSLNLTGTLATSNWFTAVSVDMVTDTIST